jgi:hypothetical protein
MPSRAELALTVRCPFCRARPGAPCLYSDVKPNKYRYDWKKDREALNGTPTKMPHQQRFHALFDKETRDAMRERYRDVMAIRMLPYQVANIRALREFDRHEAEQLATWFRTYGSIFEEIR